MPVTINGTTGISLIQDGVITQDDFASGSVTADALSSTLDLTGKTVTLPVGVGGKVLQFVSSSSSGQLSTSANSFTSTGVSVSITPVSQTSVMLVNFYDAQFYNPNGSVGRFQIQESATSATSDTYGTSQGGSNALYPFYLKMVHDHNSTIELTYTLYWYTTANTVYLSYNGPGRNFSVMEIET